MDSTFINTRADLDAITGTPAHDTFMAALAGSVWRLEKDDELKTWRAVQDTSTIERFDFALSDFAATVERTSPLVATLAAALGLDDAALDALFMAGAAL